MKKSRLLISLMIGLLCLFSLAVVLADPVGGSGRHTPVDLQVAIGLGIMVLIAALVGWFALKHLYQNNRKTS